LRALTPRIEISGVTNGGELDHHSQSSFCFLRQRSAGLRSRRAEQEVRGQRRRPEGTLQLRPDDGQTAEAVQFDEATGDPGEAASRDPRRLRLEVDRRDGKEVSEVSGRARGAVEERLEPARVCARDDDHVQAAMAVGFKKNGTYKEYPPKMLALVSKANLDFTEQHWDEIQKMAQMGSDDK
jgi:hypothetical protein